MRASQSIAPQYFTVSVLLLAGWLTGSRGLLVHPHVVDIHVGQAVISGQVDWPAAPGGKVDHEEERTLSTDR
jgi:hypothetical protein